MRILAIGAHPDDIEIGCGGTLLSSATSGHDVFIYTVTRGEVGGDPEERVMELRRAARGLKARKLWIDCFPDSKLSANAELIYHVEWVIERSKPDVIFTHSRRDIHHDHRAVAIATMEAGRRVPNILAYEIPVTKRFSPEVFVDISEVIDRKLELIEHYSSQNHRDYTRKEAIKGLAQYRALQSRNSQFVSYAEAFEVVKLAFDGNFSILRTMVPTSPSDKLSYDVSKIIDLPLADRMLEEDLLQ